MPGLSTAGAGWRLPRPDFHLISRNKKCRPEGRHFCGYVKNATSGQAGLEHCADFRTVQIAADEDQFAERAIGSPFVIGAEVDQRVDGLQHMEVVVAGDRENSLGAEDVVAMGLPR